ncbi:MAG: squalene/phytoene synthase family protein [Alphaproteobacteria bacterium]|nr:squalene/phytoene synthase family protein [Alphaproteobacteria bacterium]
MQDDHNDALSDVSYCADLVRGADPDRFATAMLCPTPGRWRLFALYAFNAEVAKTREAVRDSMIGEIRLQWWRDAIAECRAGTPRRHQVLHPLATAILDCNLPESCFLEVIDARGRDLDDLPPVDEDELQTYIEGSGGAIGELAYRCAVPEEALTQDGLKAGRAAGRAWAWIGLARGLHVHRVLGRHTIPATWLARYPDLSQEVAVARVGEASRAWTEWLVKQARAELPVVRRGAITMGKSGHAALAPARLAALYGKRLQGVGYDPYQLDINTLAPARRAWSLLGTSLFGWVL